jgi:EAL domain-containing protein (putative c-di-GMP-specific phosphodiesterase class I)/CheY-like chemotaxis protein
MDTPEERARNPRVVVADDEPHVVAYVRAVLELEHFDVVGEAADADGAVRLCDRLRPDIVLLDLRMPGGGLNAAQLIAPLNPETHIVIFSAEADGPQILPLLRTGIDGYVVKGCTPEQLVGALRSVLTGGTYLSPEVSRVAMDELTNRLHAEQLDELREDRRRSAITDTITARRFHTVVQPIVTVTDGTLHGAEALTRFTTLPARAPDLWFREAEQVGLQVPLELATANAALDELARMRPELRLTVNLSPATVLSARVGEILTTAPLDRVIIELTEHEPVTDYGAVAAALAPWRARGARLAVDDAGGGYASFSHILNLAPEYIKLDMNLTADIDADRQRQALARAVIAFAREMGVSVIAEAVETAEQLQVLEGLGTHYVQGYHVGRPLPLDEQPLLLADDAAVEHRPIDIRSREDADLEQRRR